MKELHTNNLKSYIVFLEKVMYLISSNMEVIKNSPSLDYKKYYLKELNNFNFIKNDTKIELLKKSFDCKKSIFRATKLGENLLKDIIKYSNRYDLNESIFFEQMEPVTKLAQKNQNDILSSLSNVNENTIINSFHQDKIQSLFKLYSEIETTDINIVEYKSFIIQNNIYNNLKYFQKNFNSKKYNKFVSII